MCRFVIVLLLCVLPLQFSLAANVDARFHAGSGHQHDGASHSHEIAVEVTADAAGADESSPRSHAECGACHSYHASALIGAQANVKRHARSSSSVPQASYPPHCDAVTERPERPNWSALV